MRQMRVLLTGHDGYIGHVLLPMLLDRGHDVNGLRKLPLRGLRLRQRQEPAPSR